MPRSSRTRPTQLPRRRASCDDEPPVISTCCPPLLMSLRPTSGDIPHCLSVASVLSVSYVSCILPCRSCPMCGSTSLLVNRTLRLLLTPPPS
jgi:hypothetical protein